MDVEVNSNGVNKKIKAHILSDEEMKRIGFRGKYYEGTDHEQDCSYWYFSRTLEPRKYQISFNIKIPKDGSDISIDVLDDSFCQHYDYQYMLYKNPEFSFALNIKKQVEELMAYLQNEGVLSGHEPNEYI